LSSGQRADDQERFGAACHRLGQFRLGPIVRQILLAGEEPHERTPLACRVVAYGAAEHRVLRLERVEHRRPRRAAADLDRHLAAQLREQLEVRRQLDTDGHSVYASTDSTGGRSRTMAVHRSPPSADAYTCPPVVPKYTPHGSSRSTDIAPRSTFT